MEEIGNDMSDLFEDIGSYLKENAEQPESEFNDGKGLLEDEEINLLILKAAAFNGDEGIDEESIFKLLQWANLTKLNHSLLTFVFEGLTDIGWDDETDQPIFRLNELGRKEVGRDA
jgi:hypothetical protein